MLEFTTFHLVIVALKKNVYNSTKDNHYFFNTYLEIFRDIYFIYMFLVIKMISFKIHERSDMRS